jgi:hypothetical protein
LSENVLQYDAGDNPDDPDDLVNFGDFNELSEQSFGQKVFCRELNFVIRQLFEKFEQIFRLFSDFIESAAIHQNFPTDINRV